MDWGIPRGVVTVTAFSDGSASVYFSTGGGLIGGGGQPQIADAARRAVEVAASAQAGMRMAAHYPLPAPGEVTFHLLTDDGVLETKVPESQLATERHELSPLGNAMQQIITQYRLWDEGRKAAL